MIQRHPKEHFVASSFQFLLPGLTSEAIQEFLISCAEKGVELKWFGAKEPTGFTSRYSSWQYAPKQKLVNTETILDGLIDMRLPLTFSITDCKIIAKIIKSELKKLTLD